MNLSQSERIGGCIFASACLLVMCGCEGQPPTKTRKPTPVIITLRVVMFVETGANLNSPTTTTGGCRLTQSEVTEMVRELIMFGPNYCPGLKFVWNETIDKLESDCMAVMPHPPFPPCFSVCSVPFANNCPRKMPGLWFLENVVNRGPGGPAGLRQRDNYVNDDNTINIYFVGNTLIGLQEELGFGWTIPPNPQVLDFVVINDGALDQADAPGDAGRLKDRAILLHEVGGHWLKKTGQHPAVPPNIWPKNLFISGPTFDACISQYGGKRPRDVLQADQQIICQNFGGGGLP